MADYTVQTAFSSFKFNEDAQMYQRTSRGYLLADPHIHELPCTAKPQRILFPAKIRV